MKNYATETCFVVEWVGVMGPDFILKTQDNIVKQNYGSYEKATRFWYYVIVSVIKINSCLIIRRKCHS